MTAEKKLPSVPTRICICECNHLTTCDCCDSGISHNGEKGCQAAVHQESIMECDAFIPESSRCTGTSASVGAMEVSYRINIAKYRAEAAKRFLTASASAKRTRTEAESNGQNRIEQLAGYQRMPFPGLEEYLRKAANEYAKATTILETVQPKSPKKPQVLGDGEPVVFLHAALRRERWLHAKEKARHLLRAPIRQELFDLVESCGIPKDVLVRAASRYLQHKKCAQLNIFKQRPTEMLLGKMMVDERIEGPGIREDPSYGVHIERCEEVLSTGKRALVARRRGIQNECDSFEEVRKRYAGRPDELYRRKTARKFAIWRRRQREEEQKERQRDKNAEKEMKRRRGHDRLLSARSPGDSSFAPFLFDLSNNTYAYSSKITEAPKLRKVMIDKYTGNEAEGEKGLDQWERARLAVKASPSFNTRVMNRFS